MFKICKNNTAGAKVVDGKLILSFPNAKTPIVWQMDLSDAKSSAFEVTEDQDNNQSVLISRKQGSTKSDIIAPFSAREDAINALMATSSALENAHGQIQPSSYTNTEQSTPQTTTIIQTKSQKKTSGGTIIATIIAIAIIIMLFGMLQSLKPRSISTGSSSSAGVSSTGTGEAGVPMSADEFLRQQ